MAVGVLAFLGLIAFLVLDAMFEQISSVQHRKYAVMADMGFSGRIFGSFGLSTIEPKTIMFCPSSLALVSSFPVLVSVHTSPSHRI